MWRGEKDPQLMKIPGIQEIEAYLSNATFRRKLLGCDPDEVDDCLSKVSREYEAIVASLLSSPGQDALILDLRMNLDRVTAELEALYDWNRRFQQTSSELFKENDRLQQENAALRTALLPTSYYY